LIAAITPLLFGAAAVPEVMVAVLEFTVAKEAGFAAVNSN
jgi:hypothetical protein